MKRPFGIFRDFSSRSHFNFKTVSLKFFNQKSSEILLIVPGKTKSNNKYKIKTTIKARQNFFRNFIILKIIKINLLRLNYVFLDLFKVLLFFHQKAIKIPLL